jgi:hypothetical protein
MAPFLPFRAFALLKRMNKDRRRGSARHGVAYPPSIPAAPVLMSGTLRLVLAAGAFAALPLAPGTKVVERASFGPSSNVKKRYPQVKLP